MAHLAQVKISFPALIEMCTTGYMAQWVECVEGLPEGAEFMWSSFDAKRRVVHLAFLHPAFPDIQPGMVVPTIPVTWRQHYSSDKVKEYLRQWEEFADKGEGTTLMGLPVVPSQNAPLDDLGNIVLGDPNYLYPTSEEE